MSNILAPLTFNFSDGSTLDGSITLKASTRTNARRSANILTNGTVVRSVPSTMETPAEARRTVEIRVRDLTATGTGTLPIANVAKWLGTDESHGLESIIIGGSFNVTIPRVAGAFNANAHALALAEVSKANLAVETGKAEGLKSPALKALMSAVEDAEAIAMGIGSAWDYSQGTNEGKGWKTEVFSAPGLKLALPDGASLSLSPSFVRGVSPRRHPDAWGLTFSAVWSPGKANRATVTDSNGL